MTTAKQKKLPKESSKNDNKAQSFIIKIDEEMKYSLNKIWAAWPWSQWVRKAKRDLWHDEVEFVVEEFKLKPFTSPVKIEYNFFWKTRYLDVDNNVVMVKMVNDALRHCEILKDDTNNYILSITINAIQIPKQERSEMEWDYVEIIITPIS